MHPPEVVRDLLAPVKLRHFAQAAWHISEPATPLTWSWHLDAIADHLQAVTDGQIRNLIINVPPGHMKSLLTCVFWPAWEWIARPDRRWLFASYAGSLSVRDSIRCRRLIVSDWYQFRWGSKFKITDDQNAKIKFENDKTGFRIATSVTGSATGERANRVVADDPHNVKERESEVKRASVIDWYDSTYSNRQCDYRTDARVIIHQRVHEKDLTGHLLERGGYDHLCLPTEYEPSRRCVTSIGWEDPRHSEGALLFPQRFGPTEVAEAKLTLGPTGYAGQHQQLPAPAGGGRFKASYFNYYRIADGFYSLSRGQQKWVVKVSECDRFAVMDPAGAEKQQNNKPCYTVIQVWDVTPGGDMVLVHQYREQVATPDAADAAVRIVRQFECAYIGIEKDGIGLGVVQNVRRSGIAVKAIKAKGSKEARSETAEIFMAAGYVHFPEGAPWLFALESELTQFPNSEYLDQADVLSYAAKLTQQLRGVPTRPDDASHEAQQAAKLETEEEAEQHPGRKIAEPVAVGEGENVDDWLKG